MAIERAIAALGAGDDNVAGAPTTAAAAFDGLLAVAEAAFPDHPRQVPEPSRSRQEPAGAGIAGARTELPLESLDWLLNTNPPARRNNFPTPPASQPASTSDPP